MRNVSKAQKKKILHIPQLSFVYGDASHAIWGDKVRNWPSEELKPLDDQLDSLLLKRPLQYPCHRMEVYPQPTVILSEIWSFGHQLCSIPLALQKPSLHKEFKQTNDFTIFCLSFLARKKNVPSFLPWPESVGIQTDPFLQAYGNAHYNLGSH